MPQARKTLQELRSALVGGTLNSVSMTVADPKKLTFEAEVNYTAQGAPTPTLVYMSTNAGKVKRYKDIDSGIKDVMSVAPGTGTISLGSIDTSELIKPTPTNPVSSAKSEVRRLVSMLAQFAANKVTANADLANLASFQNGSASQQEIYANALNARDAIVAGETSANARKTVLDQFIAANGG